MKRADSTVPAVVLGARGYVGAELLRLIAQHPQLHLAAAVSRSGAGEAIAARAPHLRLAYRDARFAPLDALEDLTALAPGDGPIALFGAAAHGESAALIDELLLRAEAAGGDVRCVDTSADFRLPDPALHETACGGAHPAPARLETFDCGLPELEREGVDGPVAHPGCFTTAVTLTAAPLVAAGLLEGSLHASAVTGSTGSGRAPKAATHHPERHGSMWAYGVLGHRHQIEMELLLARVSPQAGGDASAAGASEAAPAVVFAPHSGPFARGIHATVFAHLRQPVGGEELTAIYREFYADCPFVWIGDTPPRLGDVVGSNACHLAVRSSGREAVALGVIDNLVKGAAGGAVQWMNRLLGLPETAGLDVPGPGWS